MYRGQMAGWIKMPLGTEVSFGSGDDVLDYVRCRHGKRHSSLPLFGPYLLWQTVAHFSNCWALAESSCGQTDRQTAIKIVPSTTSCGA